MFQMNDQQFDDFWPLLRARIDRTVTKQIATSQPATTTVSASEQRSVASAVVNNFLADQLAQHGASSAGNLACANYAASLYTTVAIFRMQQHSATPKSASSQNLARGRELAMFERASIRRQP